MSGYAPGMPCAPGLPYAGINAPFFAVWRRWLGSYLMLGSILAYSQVLNKHGCLIMHPTLHNAVDFKLFQFL